MALPVNLSTIFQCIDQNQEKFKERLQEALRISNSTSEETQNSNGIIQWADKLLKSLGFLTSLKNVNGDSTGQPISLPCVIFGALNTGKCPNKITILIYFHLKTSYLDREEALSTRIYQGFHGKDILNLSPLIAWMNTIEAYQNAGIDYPVDIKFIIAPLETELRVGFNNLLKSEKDAFLDNVDYICMSEGSWLKSDTPIFVKKLRGMCYFSVGVQSSENNLESNICSGVIQDAMGDLMFLLGSITDGMGSISYSELGLEIEEPTVEEMAYYESADLDLNIFKEATGANAFMFGGDISEILKHRLLFPTLTIHSIINSEVDESSIPAYVSAKLSVRTYYSKISEIFENFKLLLEKHWSFRKSTNKLRITFDKSYEPWSADFQNIHYNAATKAAEYVYQKPLGAFYNQYTIPIVNTLEETIGKNLLLLPIVPENNYVNNTIPLKNYLDASKFFASYLHEMGGIPKLSSKSSTSFVSCASIPEICVCGKVEGEIQAASGDSDSQKPKSHSEEENKCVCPYRNQVEVKDAAIISENIIDIKPPVSPIPKPCKCATEQQPINVEIISLISNASTASRDPTPELQPKDLRKKSITPSVDTLNCACISKRFKRTSQNEEKQIAPEMEEELMKSMVSVGSKISGISACENLNDELLTPNMKIMGCMCPEKSQATVCEIERQKDRMFCPIRKGNDEICNKGGKRKHHIAGPPIIDEEESEISLGPLSHCSCSEESIAVVANCDCLEEPPKQIENMEDEID